MALWGMHVANVLAQAEGNTACMQVKCFPIIIIIIAQRVQLYLTAHAQKNHG